jgi:hypothetical protein
MRVWKSWIAVGAFGVMLGLTCTAFASHHGSANNAPPPAPPPAAPPPASQPSVPSQFSVDEAAQSAAAAELAAEQQKLKDISDAQWAKFQQDQDWVTAQTKVVNAQADLDTAKQAANDALANNPDYQGALAAKKKAVDDLATAKAGDDATPETLAPLANASLKATLNLRQITNSVLINDSGVQTATENLAIAQHGADMLKMKFQVELSTERAYAGAKAAVDTAQKRYDDAHAKLLADNGGT